MIITKYFYNDTFLYCNFRIAGKLHTSPVWSQGGLPYVETGRRITRDRTRHFFTPAQRRALSAFEKSGRDAQRFYIGIA